MDIVKLKAVGDIMLGDHPVCLGHGVRSKIEKFGIDYLFKGVADQLQGADILFGNLETVLSDIGYDNRFISSIEMRGRSRYAQKLADIGFTVMSVANNHIAQHGVAAFNDTIKSLKENSIFPVGEFKDGLTNSYKFQKGNVKICLISYSMRPEKYHKGFSLYSIGSEEKILGAVKRNREKNDIVIVSLHWGEEYVNLPSRSQIVFAHNLIDAGASLILGHHPHVLQGIEKYKHGCIVYSLGNFIFDKWQRNPRETMILNCELRKEGVTVNFVPVYISKDYRPDILTGTQAEILSSNIQSYSNQIDEIWAMDMVYHAELYQKYAYRAYLKFRISSYCYFVRNFYRYSPMMLQQSLFRSFFRRLGK